MTERLKSLVGILGLVALGMLLQHWMSKEPSDPLPIISLPSTVQVQPGIYFEVKAQSQGQVQWLADGLVRFPGKLADENAGFFMAAKPGVYTVRAYTATRGWLPWSRALPSEAAECKVTASESPIPEPPPPIPPTPSVNPFPGSPPGLRVLIIYDQTKLLPKEIQPILTSTKLRAFLDANCAKQGNWPEYRFFDKSTPLGNESALWQGVFATAKDKGLPVLLIGNGAAGFDGPLPDSVDGVIATVQKYVAPQRSELPRIRPRRETLWTLGV